MIETSMTWGKNATFAAINLILAELCWRICRILHEYVYYSKHYPIKNKFRTIVYYGLSFKPLFRYFVMTLVVLVSIQYASILVIVKGILEQSYLLPVWIVFRYVQLTKSPFDYADFIRSTSGLDYATGMASNYFHGYLHIILPQHDEQKGIVERIENYESRHNVEFAVKRLIILIPYSLHTRPVIQSPLMERQDGQPLEYVSKNRAGVARPYKNDVYRIKIDNKPYYISVEGATPLLSYFDALHFSPISTWQMKAMQQEIMIKFYRYLKNTLENWAPTQEQCEFVFYNDYTTDGRQQDVGEILCLHIKDLWKKKEMENSMKTEYLD